MRFLHGLSAAGDVVVVSPRRHHHSGLCLVVRVLLNGRYVAPTLQPDDFTAIQRAILAALEIGAPKTVGYNESVPALS
jgi:hypothetical protein